MPDLSFAVEDAEVIPFAATPQLAFKLRVQQRGEVVPIQTISLCCQVRIEPGRRRHGEAEQGRLLDLFGEPARWGQTVRPMLWTHASVNVPAFEEAIVVDLPVPCTYDFNVAATKYFAALEAGEIPLNLLFSGTIFYRGAEDTLQVAPIPWNCEAAFRLPVHIWREMMERYYPNSAWLCLRRDVFERLYEFKRRQGLPTWEQALERLLGPESTG